MQIAKQNIIKYLLLGVLVAALCPINTSKTLAASCPDLKVIFARGSGAERYNNADYESFKSALEAKLKTSSLSYEFDDLDYPAIGIANENLSVALGAFISGGESYEFGDSVKQGINKLSSIVNDSTCSNTKYVIAGYSQGAMVISGGLARINPSQILYSATFGDPKIFLPEGAGPVPIACKGENLSDYRIYVPDCRAYKGLLGAKEPYATIEYTGKLGTWCNKQDIFCSSHYSISSHTSYEKDGLYEDASRLIFSKIAAYYKFKNKYTSPHDTAIMIDSTGSMSNVISQYKSEALELAEKTISSGGRVALYDYRDLSEGYNPKEGCNFETCDIETFKNALENITTNGGGDTPESLLSSSFQVMKKLDWKLGSTKSLVILTDASYHNPDHDGTSFYDVVSLSKQIDPVNFYIITNPENMDAYRALAEATDGNVVSTTSELSLLTDEIMERFDSLPRVEEEPDNLNQDIPFLENVKTSRISETDFKITFNTNAAETIVILNDMILGITNQNDFTITDLDIFKSNTLQLVPLLNSIRGETITVGLTGEPKNRNNNLISTKKHHANLSAETKNQIIIPKAPNTGYHL